MKCTDCKGVKLCLFCFKNFHTIKNLAAARDRLCKEICDRTKATPKNRKDETKKKGAKKGANK